MNEATGLERIAARLRDGERVDGAVLGPQGPLVDDALGLVVDEVALDRVTAHLVADSRHHQPFGIVHGGVWCTVVETLASIAGSLQVADHSVVVGVSNSTDLIRSHRVGRVDAVAEPVHVGRRQQLWQVALRRADGELVARGQVRLHNLPHDRAAEG